MTRVPNFWKDLILFDVSSNRSSLTIECDLIPGYLFKKAVRFCITLTSTFESNASGMDPTK